MLNGNKDIDLKIPIEVVSEKKQDIEFSYLGTINPYRGHNLYEINTKTLVCVQAKFIEHKDIHWLDAIRFCKSGFKKEVVANKNCIYISALNKKSALKRFKENKESALKPKGNSKINW